MVIDTEEHIQCRLEEQLHEQLVIRFCNEPDTAWTNRNLAENESCVIVGRCSDYILRDRKDCLNVFVYADTEKRATNILKRYGETDKPIQKRIADKDARRKIYYSQYADRPWGMPQNYDLCLNSGTLGEELCVEIIKEAFQK